MSSVVLSILIENLKKKISLRTATDITVFDLCRQIQSVVKNAGQGPEYGIFVADIDPKHSFWLESSRLLSYYHLQDGMEVAYKYKLRRLVVSTIDGTRKTLQVDDSKTIADLMVTICGKMGITNHEEYSLVHEKGRLQTLRRPKNVPRDYDKLEKMKQKLQTDDDANWLQHAKTFRQLGIEEADNLLLRRKYFFSDQNVGARDPVQLNLLFIQLKEAILNGAHPISVSQAIQLAGLQCQAEMGNLVSEKIKSMNIDVKEHLPREYIKVKGIEKKIKEQYQKLNGLSEKDAKVRYIQVCRSLPTYGITFFLIKEKLPGRNKLVPRLFGVSKESVMRVDENTKDIMQTWSLTRVRRWAATANLFTLDFGEYSSDGNYVIQTSEGEQIAQLISGYIDIILRRKKKPDAMAIESGDSNIILEENVGPSRAEIISNTGTMGRGYKVSSGFMATEGYASQASTFTRGYARGSPGERVSDRYPDGSGVAMRAQTLGGKRGNATGNEVQIKELSQPKRAVMHRIDTSTKEIRNASESLQKPFFEDSDTVARNDHATQRWRSDNMSQARAGICSHLGAMTIATGNLVTLLEPSQGRFEDDDNQEPIDYTAMDAALAAIGLNVQWLMRNVRMLDQLQTVDAGDESQGHIMNAAQDVAAAFLNLMESAMPLKDRQPQDLGAVDRPSVYEAASRVGDASQQLLQLVSASQLSAYRRRRHRLEPIPEDENENENDNEDYESDSELIANAHAMDWQLRDDLLAATKEVASATANLVKFAKSAAVAISQEATELANTETDSGEMALQRDDKVAFLRESQTQLVQAATHAGKTTSRLVTGAKVAVCTMEQPASQHQLLGCVKQVGQAVDLVSDVASRVAEAPFLPLETMEQRTDQTRALGDLHRAATDVSTALEGLMNRLVAGSIQAQQDPVVLNLLDASQQVPAALGNGEALLQQANNLVSTAVALVDELRTNKDLLATAGVGEAEAARRASLLRASIGDLVDTMNALKNGNQQSLPHQQELVAAANRLIDQTHNLASPIIRSKLTTGLEFATRLTASNASQLAALSEEAARRTRSSQFRLLQELDQLSGEIIPQANLSCDQARAHPHDPSNQSNLLAASKNLMDCLKDFLGSVDVLAPTVPDPGIQMVLTNAAQNTLACLSDLRQCCATADPILQNPPPPLLNLQTDLPARRESQTAVPVAVVKRQAWPSIYTSLSKMQNDLESNSDHVLPGQTLDSVCGDLLTAVAKFGEIFALDAHGQKQDPILPQLLAQEARQIAGGLTVPGVGPDRLPPVTAKLLGALRCVVNGVRDLAGYFNTIKLSGTQDPVLEDVLLSSWMQLPDEHQKEHDRRFDRSSSPELSVGLAAEGLRNALLHKGLQCIGQAHASLLWAVHEDDDPAVEQAVFDRATELQLSIKDLRKFVPGSQVASKLGSLLDELPVAADLSNGTPKRPQQATKAVVAHRTTDPAALLRALKELADASEETSRIAASGQTARRRDELAPSSTCSLAAAADRLANALFHVLEAVNGADSGRSSTASSPQNDEVLSELRKMTKPLAAELERALSCEGVVQTPVNVMFVSKASLQLRDWVLNVTKATEDQMAREDPGRTGVTDSPERTIETVKEQLASARQRLRPVPDASGHSGDIYPLVSYPVAKLTYPECIDEIDDLVDTLGSQMDCISVAAKSSNKANFCAAAQGVADAVMGILQAASQSAYLVGASQPCNEPGRAPRLTPEEAQQVAKDAETLQHNLDVVIRESPAFGSDPARATQLAVTINDVTRASSSMCQLARQCIAECIDPSEKKMLAEHAKEVAQTTTQLVKVVNADDEKNPAVGAQVSQISGGLKHSAARLADALREDVGEMPVQVLNEAGVHQAPILARGKVVLENADHLTDQMNRLFKEPSSQSAEINYNASRKGLEKASQDLRSCIHELRPGLKALEELRAVSKDLLRQLDHAALEQYDGEVSNLEGKAPLINSSLHQITALSGKMAGDWRQSRWELVSLDASQIASYLSSMASVCISASVGLNRSSDQAALQSYLRTVLETTEHLVDRIITAMNHRSGSPADPGQNLVATSADQLRLACRELLICIEDLTSRQGSLNAQIATIQVACSKLDEGMSLSFDPERTSLVPLQTRLASQAQSLGQTGARLADAAKAGGSGAEEAAAGQTVKGFSQAVETTQQLCALLGSSSSRVGAPQGTSAKVANRLRLVVQSIGASCIELLENPKHPDGLRSLANRVSNLIAVIRESAHGVHACVTVADGIANKVAEFDSAIYFARANSLVNKSGFNGLPSPTAVANDIQASQEEIMHLIKGIVEETNALTRNTNGDQDKLAVSAQNCLLHVNNLHAKTLQLLSRPDFDALSPFDEEAKTEARVSLLTASRAVSASLIELLTHSRNLVTAERAASSAAELQLNSTAANVVSRVAELRSSMKHFSEVFIPPKSPSVAAGQPATQTPMGKKLVITKLPKSEPVTEDSATTAVRAGLQSVRSTVEQLARRLEGWSPATGTFTDGDTLESEREKAANDETTPKHIQEAALGITQAALKANNATAAGRKLADISLAGEVIHRAATDLVRRLRCGSRAAMLCVTAATAANQRKLSTTVAGVDAAEEVRRAAEVRRCGAACTRMIDGGKATLNELSIMVENMIKSLDDPGSGQPPAMQVTLTMRRLRETVYEIVEGVKQMPGEARDSESAAMSYRRTDERGAARASPPPPPIPRRPKSVLQTPAAGSTDGSYRSELAFSIHEATNIATDVGDAAGTEELRGFTNEIEQSMQKLAQLQTRAAAPAPKVPPRLSADARKSSSGAEDSVIQEDSDLVGIGAILVMCKRLAHAAASLMHWATAAQRELVKQGRLRAVSENVDETEAESQWTCGLVSAARFVSAATVHLVESAETMVTSGSGEVAPEGIVAAARTAVSYTGQLLFACLAKADADSESMRGLNNAASAVRRYAERLVELTAKQRTEHQQRMRHKVTAVNEEEPEPTEPSGPRKGTVEAMREVIETKSSIASKMVELEKLQNRLKSINQESYRHKDHDDSEF